MTRFLLFSLILSSSIAISKDVDYRILDLDKNYDYGNQKINEDDFLNFNITDLSAQFGVGAQCGQLSFKSNFNAAINKIKTQFSARQLIAGLAAASPMLLACQYSPSLCTAIENMEQSVNFLMKFNIDQCAIIDKFTSDKAQAYNQKIADCIGAAKAKGLDSFEAHESCVTSTSDKLASITGDMKYVGTVNVLEDSFKWMGLSDNKTTQEAKELIGETSINHGIIKESFGKNGKPITPFQKELQIKKNIVDTFCQKLNNNKAVSKRGVIPLAKSANLYTVLNRHFHNQTLQNLGFIPSFARKNYCFNIATFIATDQVVTQSKKLYDALSQALTNPNLKEMERQILELKVKKLETYIKIQAISNVETNSSISTRINNEAEHILKNLYNREQKSLKTYKIQNQIQKKLSNRCLYSVRC